MEDYRVQLDFYDGPMDLLLYLVRKNEVDIQDIPIAAITEQYCRYVELMRAIDINLAGEFLVMAAWLIEIKTRMLLPSELPPPTEGEAGPAEAAEALADPRAELVRQLLAYKQFRTLADELGEAAAEAAMRYPRAGIDWKQIAPELADEPEIDIADAGVWDLFEAFGRLLEQTGRLRPHEVSYDDTPIHVHADHLVARLGAEGPLAFRRIFEGRSRSEFLGLFLALLELVRQKRIRVEQEGRFGEIFILPAPEPADANAAAPPAEAATPEPPPPAKPKFDAEKIRRRRSGDEPPAGVTWVDPEEGEESDHALREIDQQLRAIRMPADPDTLIGGSPESPPDEAAAPEPSPPQAGPPAESQG
ncbi:MAG: Segregation and condensation protein A [Phycisphaerae bacterium]|nr:Segregation and condensation protein A [Phycisphaerae bacterium]